MPKIMCAVCEGFGTVTGVSADYSWRERCRACDGCGIAKTGQSRKTSLIEVCFNTAIGFVVAYAANAVVMPAFGHHVSATENFWITAIFTVISIARGYCVRRLFEAMR